MDGTKKLKHGELIPFTPTNEGARRIVYRSWLEHDYTTVPNLTVQQILRENLAALGLWLFMISQRPDCELGAKDIQKWCKIGRDQRIKLTHYLEERGVVRRRILRDFHKRFAGEEFAFFSTPQLAAGVDQQPGLFGPYDWLPVRDRVKAGNGKSGDGPTLWTPETDAVELEATPSPEAGNGKSGDGAGDLKSRTPGNQSLEPRPPEIPGPENTAPSLNKEQYKQGTVQNESDNKTGDVVEELQKQDFVCCVLENHRIGFPSGLARRMITKYQRNPEWVLGCVLQSFYQDGVKSRSKLICWNLKIGKCDFTFLKGQSLPNFEALARMVGTVLNNQGTEGAQALRWSKILAGNLGGVPSRRDEKSAVEQRRLQMLRDLKQMERDQPYRPPDSPPPSPG